MAAGRGSGAALTRVDAYRSPRSPGVATVPAPRCVPPCRSALAVRRCTQARGEPRRAYRRVRGIRRIQFLVSHCQKEARVNSLSEQILR